MVIKHIQASWGAFTSGMATAQAWDRKCWSPLWEHPSLCSHFLFGKVVSIPFFILNSIIEWFILYEQTQISSKVMRLALQVLTTLLPSQPWTLTQRTWWNTGRILWARWPQGFIQSPFSKSRSFFLWSDIQGLPYLTSIHFGNLIFHFNLAFSVLVQRDHIPTQTRYACLLRRACSKDDSPHQVTAKRV